MKKILFNIFGNAASVIWWALTFAMVFVPIEACFSLFERIYGLGLPFIVRYLILTAVFMLINAVVLILPNPVYAIGNLALYIIGFTKIGEMNAVFKTVFIIFAVINIILFVFDLIDGFMRGRR